MIRLLRVVARTVSRRYNARRHGRRNELGGGTTGAPSQAPGPQEGGNVQPRHFRGTGTKEAVRLQASECLRSLTSEPPVPFQAEPSLLGCLVRGL